MKPSYILKLCLYVNLGVLALAFLFPKDGISLTDNLTLSFNSFDDYFFPKKVEYVNLAQVLKPAEEKKENAVVQVKEEESTYDSLAIIHNDTSRMIFNQFYARLEKADTLDRPVRILHFGDSQIEADRITGTLREKMQEKFGGCGMGLLPLSEVSEARAGVFTSISNNWIRNVVSMKPDKSVPDRKYGLLGYVHRYSSLAADSLSQTLDAWVQVRTSKGSYPRAQRPEVLSVLYTSKDPGCHYEISGDSLSEDGFLNEDGGLHMLRADMKGRKNVKIRFTSSVSPAVYGVACDCKGGVAVDNVSLRGSSGFEFGKMNKEFLAQQMKALNTGMIIFHFGVNVVPSVLSDYSYYENQLYTQLMQFRTALPEVPILVVGVSDMSRKEKGVYVSYPNLELVKAAQKNAALRAGCAFWDLLSNMGGLNSMPSWVEAKPSLANKDYIHFNIKGAEVIGQKLYTAIFDDYLLHKARPVRPAIKKDTIQYLTLQP